MTGGASLVGHFLLPRLVAAYDNVHVVSRRGGAPGTPPGVQWHQMDLTAGLPQLAIGVTHVAHLAPLWLLPPLLGRMADCGMRRIVAFSSTSRFTKLASRDAVERRVAQALADSEQAMVATCARLGATWTLLRPTLTYGAGLDGNVSLIARFIRSWHFFAIAGPATGRRQPVHADDLAQACVAALGRASAANRAYDLSGGSTLTYREMVEAVFAGLGREPRILVLPPALLRAALRIVSHWPGRAALSPQMADRMLEDLCFDHGAAARDLDFRPRAFSYPG